MSGFGLRAKRPDDDERVEDLLDGFEQRAVDDFAAFLGEHDISEDDASLLISRIETAFCMAAQERYVPEPPWSGIYEPRSGWPS